MQSSDQNGYFATPQLRWRRVQHGAFQELLAPPLKDLAQIPVVGVASHFVESQLNSGSTVSVMHAFESITDSDGFLSGGTSGAGGLDGRDWGGVDSDIVVAKGGAG